ncbi:MAG: nitroreductase family protein [Fimbriimonadaceae bacterium]|nr:nitroreductase family protein [Fimbriimonadaceae bacterium]
MGGQGGRTVALFDEGFAESWERRYGVAPAFTLNEVERFLTHRSVRRYADRPIAEETVAALIAAAQSAATSSNLQLWSVISVQDADRRAALAQLCDNQKQVLAAPWFLAFLADHHRLRQAALAVGENPTGLDYTEFFLMAAIDAALAGERLVCAAESLGIGICYIGALRNNPAGVKELLELPEGVFGLFGLCLGYPDPERPAEIKPRLSQEAVWFRETYDRTPRTAEYDARMRSFYESQRMKGDVTWSMRSGKRADDYHLTGREVLLEWLCSQGFNRR